MAREIAGDLKFMEVFIDTPLDICERRDPKGLYAKARQGILRNFTGVDSPFESPEHPDVRLSTVGRAPEDLAQELVGRISQLVDRP